MKTRTKNRSCTGKRGHETRQAAVDAMWSLIRRHLADRLFVHVYACGHCSQWHVGHRGARR